MTEADSTGSLVGKLRARSELLTIWRLTPDPAFRDQIERELYGEPAPARAAEEAERLTLR